MWYKLRGDICKLIRDPIELQIYITLLTAARYDNGLYPFTQIQLSKRLEISRQLVHKFIIKLSEKELIIINKKKIFINYDRTLKRNKTTTENGTTQTNSFEEFNPVAAAATGANLAASSDKDTTTGDTD